MSPATASWLGIDQDGLTSTMRTQRLERYVLRHEGTGDYLRVNEESEIERSSSPESAWDSTPMTALSPMPSGLAKCSAKHPTW